MAAMNRQRPNRLQGYVTAEKCGALFLSFCRALDKYCDQIGVINRRSGVPRILHGAACNTVANMRDVTPATRRHMAQMEREIPNLFTGLIAIYYTDGFLKTIDQMSDMTLAQIAERIAENRHSR